MQVDQSRYKSRFSLAHKLRRGLWGAVYATLFRLSPRPLFGWRNMLLRLFGARIGRGSVVYPSCRIWAPWNLRLGEYVCLSFDVDCYCVDTITVGSNSTVSQYAFLCTAGHDITDPRMPLVTAPIGIGHSTWVCAGAFIAPGVTIGEGAVVAARAVVTKDVQPWVVVGGNPARPVKERILEERAP